MLEPPLVTAQHHDGGDIQGRAGQKNVSKQRCSCTTRAVPRFFRLPGTDLGKQIRRELKLGIYSPGDHARKAEPLLKGMLGRVHGTTKPIRKSGFDINPVVKTQYWFLTDLRTDPQTLLCNSPSAANYLLPTANYLFPTACTSLLTPNSHTLRVKTKDLFNVKKPSHPTRISTKVDTRTQFILALLVHQAYKTESAVGVKTPSHLYTHFTPWTPIVAPLLLVVDGGHAALDLSACAEQGGGVDGGEHACCLRGDGDDEIRSGRVRVREGI